MKRLWKKIVPCLSDIQGFQEIIKNTNGLGIVDDSSNYKPAKIGVNSQMHGGHMHDISKTRMTSSNIKEVDVINGSRKKMLEAFDKAYRTLDCDFVLITSAPCATMINTNLDEIADYLKNEYDIPVGVVPLDGEKDYLYGMSLTLEEIGKVLLSKQEKIPNTVNILGINEIDWNEDDLSKLEDFFKEKEITVLAKWGVKEDIEHLKKSTAAAFNLVVHISGLRLAQYMEKEFGIPYLVGCPFGKDNLDHLLKEVHIEKLEEVTDSPFEAIVIGEQVEANAIRKTLMNFGYSRVKVLSFFHMDKSLMEDGDKKLTSEDELIEQLEDTHIRLVVADPDYNIINTDKKWINLANKMRISPSISILPISLFGENLDEFIKQELEGGETL